MQVKLTLYKCKLSPTDTMMFAGDTPAQIKNNQEAFFNTLPKVVYANCSFNGSRSVRIAGNYFELNLSGYNYCKIEHTRRGVTYKFYGFIDLYRYVNDECCEIDITCDFIQTYLTEIQLAAPFIDQRNYSLNADLYKTPYHNFYPVSRMVPENVITCASEKYLTFIIAPTKDKIETIFKGDIGTQFPIDVSGDSSVRTTNGVFTILFPLDDLNFNQISNIIDDVDGNKNNTIITIDDFIRNFSDEIIDVGICEYLDVIKYNSVDGQYHIGADNGFDYKFYNVGDSSNQVYVLTLIGRRNALPMGRVYEIHRTEKEKTALFISPYYEYYIGRRTSFFTINPLNSHIEGIDYLEVTLLSNILGERDVIVFYPNNIAEDDISSIKNPCGYVFHTKDAWETYRNTHTATVGDSLATKHKYDLEIAERNKQAGTNKTTASGIGSGIKTIIGYIEDAISSVTSLLGGNTNIKIPILSIGKSVTDIGTNTYKSITDINTAYENAKTNIQKERDLLELEYNNIKNTPNEALNQNSSTYYKTYDEIKLSVYEAENIDQIKKYHKKFGFQTSLQSDSDMTLSQLHDNAARHFDYIVTKNASIISENIPKSAAANIEKIFDNGIYLWRDYNKLGEDYFSNYNGE